jgi:NADH-quinone oxidoreductase subunit K
MLLCIELMFFSLSLNFIYLSVFTYQPIGQIFALLIVTTAASETAIGLGLLVVVLRLSNKINYNALITLRG